MTGLRRLSILAIAATLIAGCGATPASSAEPSGVPSSSPASAVEPSPQSTGTHAPIRTPVALSTPEPSPPRCPPAAVPGEPVVELSNALDVDYAGLQITSIAPLADPSLEQTPAPQAFDPATVHLVGGRETALDLSYAGYSWPSDTFNNETLITAFRATVKLEGRSPIELAVRLEPRRRGATNVVIVAVPDLDATGTIDVEVEWHDTCFVFTGALSTPVRIYAAATVAGCPRKRDAAFDEFDELFDPPIQIGQIDADLAPWLFAGKVTSLAFSGHFMPPYTGFNRDSPRLGASPGATIAVSNANEDLELHAREQLEVSFFYRGPLLRWLEGGWIHGDEPDAEVVFQSGLFEHPDGMFTFAVPTDPARYVAQVAFDYDSACSHGTAGFAVEIDVLPPATGSIAP